MIIAGITSLIAIAFLESIDNLNSPDENIDCETNCIQTCEHCPYDSDRQRKE